MDFSRIVVRDAAHSKAVLCSWITFLRLAKNISSLEFQCHSVSGERLAVVISTPFLDESAVVERHVVALIRKQGRIHLSICGPRFGQRRAVTEGADMIEH